MLLIENLPERNSGIEWHLMDQSHFVTKREVQAINEGYDPFKLRVGRPPASEERVQ